MERNVLIARALPEILHFDVVHLAALHALREVLRHFTSTSQRGEVEKLTSLTQRQVRAKNSMLASRSMPEAAARSTSSSVMPSTNAAIGEMRFARKELGFRGGFLRPNPYADRLLHSPDYEPFWREAEELDFCIGLHEGGNSGMPTVGVDRFDRLLHIVHVAASRQRSSSRRASRDAPSHDVATAEAQLALARLVATLCFNTRALIAKSVGKRSQSRTSTWSIFSSQPGTRAPHEPALK